MSLTEFIESFKRGEITPEDCVKQMAKESRGNLANVVKGLPGLPKDKFFELLGVAYDYDKGMISLNDEYERVRRHSSVRVLMDAYDNGEYSEEGLILAFAQGNVAESVGLADMKNLVDILCQRYPDEHTSPLHRALSDYDLAVHIRKGLEQSDLPSLVPRDNEETFALCSSLETLLMTHSIPAEIKLSHLVRLLNKSGVMTIAGIQAVTAYERGSLEVIEGAYIEAGNPKDFAHLIAERWQILRDDPGVISAYNNRPPHIPWSQNYCRVIYGAITARLKNAHSA